MKKICIIGSFAFNTTHPAGQDVKTKTLYKVLQEQCGEKFVSYVDTTDWKKHPLKTYADIKRAVKENDALIMLPAHNGLRVFAPMLVKLRGKRSKKLFYDVIGGWLPEFIKSKNKLKKSLQKFDGIYVETSIMKLALEKQGFSNIYVMSNFKELKILQRGELIYPEGPPLKLCTFSRVNRKKGIEDAVDAVKQINKEMGYVAYALDIYGPIDKDEGEWFNALKESFPSCITYKGIIPPEQSVNVLKNYFALLFPTHYFTEGVPGTVLDAYASGVPVIASKWENYCDVVSEGQTGLGYAFSDPEDLKNLLKQIVRNPKKLLELRENCLEKAHNYSPEKVSFVLIDKLSDGL